MMYLFYILKFVLLCVFVLIPLGLFVTRILKIDKMTFWENVSMALNLGSIFFALLTFITWYFKLYFFSYLLCLLTTIYLFFLLFKQNKKQWKFGNLQINIIPLLSILLVVLICSAIAIKSGDEINGGIRFIGANAHDGLSFLALEQELQRNIPPQNPTFSGVTLSNYHYLVYLLISGIEFITNIPLPVLNFKIIIPFFVLLYSTSIYFLIHKITDSKLIGIAGVLLTSLASNVYYIAPLLSQAAVTSPSVFWVNEYLTRMVNPQLVYSYIVILTILLLTFNLNKKSKSSIVVMGLLTGILITVKAFSSVLFVGALFILALLKFKDKEFVYFKILVFGLIFSVIFYLISGNKLNSLLIFSPLWFIKNMYESPDHLNLSDWELRRQFYLSKGNFIRIFQLYIQGLIIFILGNLGGRILGIFAYDKTDHKVIKDVKFLLIFMGILSMIIPLLFLVKGIAWNSIQFFYYSIFSFSILTTLFLSKFLNRKKILGFSLFMVIFITLLPGVYYSTASYLSTNNETIFPKSLYQGAKFLKSQRQGAVLIDPIFTNDTFVSAISGHNAYFADESWLGVQLVPLDQRRREVKEFFDSKGIDYDFLLRNNIKFIFTHSEQSQKFLNNNLKNTYENEEVAIYEVK